MDYDINGINVKKSLMVVFFVVAIFLSVFAGVFAANKVYYLVGDVPQVEEIDEVTTERFNILVLGLDVGEYRSDTIILFSVDLGKRKINALSIPRDTRVMFGGREGKINSSIAIGAQEVHKGNIKEVEDYAIKKVKELIGLPIHYFISIDTRGFRNVVDILGGVDFDIPIDMEYSDPTQDLHIHLKKGQQHLNGSEAEQLVRFRKDYAEGDLGRVRAQQIFLKAVLEQKLKPKYVVKMSDIYAQIRQNIKTNYTTADLAKHLLAIKGISAGDVSFFELPGEARTINALSYYICDINATCELINQYFRISD